MRNGVWCGVVRACVTSAVSPKDMPCVIVTLMFLPCAVHSTAPCRIT